MTFRLSMLWDVVLTGVFFVVLFFGLAENKVGAVVAPLLFFLFVKVWSVSLLLR